MERLSRETSERKLPLPVGKSDWEEVAAHCYCVDKTLLIRDLLEARTGVALFTRPRRFGKTTAMQMLKCFFEKRGEGEPDVRHLFESRAIAHCERADEWMAKQGKSPVIYLNLQGPQGAHVGGGCRTARSRHRQRVQAARRMH